MFKKIIRTVSDVVSRINLSMDKLILGDANENLIINLQNLDSKLDHLHNDTYIHSWDEIKLLRILSGITPGSTACIRIQNRLSSTQNSKFLKLITPLGSGLANYDRLMAVIKKNAHLLDKQSLRSLTTMSLSQWKLLGLRGNALEDLTGVLAQQYIKDSKVSRFSDAQLDSIRCEVDNYIETLNASIESKKLRLRRLFWTTSLLSLGALLVGFSTVSSASWLTLMLTVGWASVINRIISGGLKNFYTNDVPIPSVDSDFINVNYMKRPTTAYGFSRGVWGPITRVALSDKDLALKLQSIMSMSDKDEAWVTNLLSSPTLIDDAEVAELFSKLVSIEDAQAELSSQLASVAAESVSVPIEEPRH